VFEKVEWGHGHSLVNGACTGQPLISRAEDESINRLVDTNSVVVEDLVRPYGNDGLGFLDQILTGRHRWSKLCLLAGAY
jgi:hypothetical protein